MESAAIPTLSSSMTIDANEIGFPLFSTTCPRTEKDCACKQVDSKMSKTAARYVLRNELKDYKISER